MTTEERLKILDMIANKQITPEEGARLLQASGSSAPAEDSLPRGDEPPAPGREAGPSRMPAPTASPSNGGGTKRLRIHVIEAKGTKVNVSLPLSLMEVGLKFGSRFVDELKDLDAEIQLLMEAVRNDVTGKIVEVDDEDSHVEIYIE